MNRVYHEIGSMLHWETNFSSPRWSWPEPAVYFSICRHAIAAICAAQPRRTVLWVPSFLCPEVARACRGVAEVREYQDDCRWAAPAFSTLQPKPNHLVLAVNYFGVRSPQTWYEWHQQHRCILIEDHTQDPFSSWALHSTADYAVCSIRKTVPVPDGSILWSPAARPLPPEPTGDDWQGSTLKAAAMLYKRMYLLGALPPEFKPRFRELQLTGEAELSCADPSSISPLSRSLISSGIPKVWREQRCENAHSLLSLVSGFLIAEPAFRSWPDGHAPFDLPFVFRSKADRDWFQQTMQQEEIYLPVEWPCDTPDPNARNLASRILNIPIDYRYSRGDMERIAAAMLKAQESGIAASALSGVYSAVGGR